MKITQNIIKNDNDNNDKQGIYYFPLIYTFFVFIMIANLLSLIPYSFSLTSNFMFIICLSFSV